MRPLSAFGLAAVLASAPALGAARVVDYLYVEANEGGSSGGHVAIRLGDDVYHFQHESPGVLRLRRDAWGHFRYVYGGLENRTMHASRVAVSNDDYARLRARFGERYLSEGRVFAQRAMLADDRVLLDLLLAHRRGEDDGAVRLRAAGFFFPTDELGERSTTGAALRARILDAYGPDALRARADAIRADIARLVPHPGATEIAPERYPDFAPAFSTRYRDLLTALAALDALDRALPLRRDAYRATELALAPAERRSLDAYADRVEGELVRLLRSTRPDWGFAFLVGMARLEALRTGSASGRLTVLDAFPPDADVVPRSTLRHDVVAALRVEAADELADARVRLQSEVPIDEAAFSALESAANRFLELDGALASDRDLRLAGGLLLPSRAAAWSEAVVPDVATRDLERAAGDARAAEAVFAARVRDRFGYDLFTRNCVSELFRTVDAAGVGPSGRIATRSSLVIPFVSAYAVDQTWDVVRRTTLPSYRRARLAAMRRDQSGLLVGLRESNVLTSTIYRRNPADSFFVLFGDDVPALRPLVGTVNLAAALGAAAAGLPLLPFDRGQVLWAGVRGAVFSLPELAFVSLRKGSFDYVPPDRRPIDDGDEPSVTERERVARAGT